MYTLLQLLILFLLLRDLHANLLSRCDFLNGKNLVKLCKGAYPSSVHIKYHDQLINLGQAYEIFQDPSSKDNYFVSFRISELQECDEISYSSPTEFKCVSTGETIELLEAKLFCYNFNLMIVDELVYTCRLENGEEGIYISSSNVALHYTMRSRLSGGDRLRNWSLLLVAVGVALILYIS